MKKVLFTLIVLAMMGAAHATKPTPPQTNDPSATANAGAIGVGLGVGVGIGGAGGSSSATGGKATSNANAQGGSASATGGANGDMTMQGDSGHTFVAPAPVVTVVPHSSGGIVTKSHAVGLVWNFVSWSKSEQMTDPFVGGMRLIAEFERLCQFETAAMIRQRQYALLDPAYRELPAQPGVRNMTPDECRAARR